MRGSSMDKLIMRFDRQVDADLALCPHRGVAYQRDMRVTAIYDGAYVEKCRSYEGKAIANAINAGRTAMVARHYGHGRALDVGVGSGEFVRHRPGTYGCDINPAATNWLIRSGLWNDRIEEFQAVTFWDVLEHMPDPGETLRRVPAGGYVFASIPVFADLTKIRDSKHYRPGEHLYYWTEEGFIRWMAEYQFRLLERDDYETRAGRDSITSFAFRRDLPGYHETVGQYRELHSSAYYGASSSIYLKYVARPIRKLSPGSILDYGCGRSDLASYFWRDGQREIYRYDPAIPEFKTMPERQFGMVLCNDVMEHIPMAEVDRVLAEVRSKSRNALFTISMKPARATLPDGRNAHVTLLTDAEWTRWIDSYFPTAVRLETEWPHVLMLKTWA